MVDLGLRSAVDLATAIKAKDLSAVELLDHYLDRVDRLNPSINALVTFDLDRARSRAAAADQVTMRGEHLPPLHGVPCSIKDAIATEGIKTTGGAVEMANNVPTEDASVVRRLKEAGAIVFAKSNLPRWSGDMQAYNDLFGTTNNPWDLSRVPGGSSGGASAAVAAGLSAFDVGTDIGGSIRGPAHFAGICGHKPSFGVVSALGYIDHPTAGLTEPDVNVLGPLARRVEDLELVFSLIAGPTEDRAPAWRLDLPPPKAANLGGYRIAAWLDESSCPVSSDVAASLNAAVGAIEGEGVGVDRAARPDLDFDVVRSVGLPLISAATSPGRTDEEFERFRQIIADPAEAAETMVMRARASAGFHRDWLLLTEQREQIRRQWAEFFTRFDICLCPVIIVPAFEHYQEGNLYSRRLIVDGQDRPYADLILWTSLIGMAYLPSTVVPVGLSPDGLPVGIQIVGPFLSDRSTLAVARHLEQLLGGYQVPPMAMLDEGNQQRGE
ncbi:MAG: amidase [Actinomycetia bacterium]|nr:amidase [Actinomycetes bacterium]